MIEFNKPPQNIWVQGWLKQKEYCGNPRHILFNPMIDNIIIDLKNGQNRILLVVGTMRSGKSYFSLWYMCYMNWCYFGREEYKPDPDNIEPLKDIYWDLDDFVEATKDPKNRDKFIMLEEQGLAQYKNDWYKTEVTNYDKITQIFGVDNTNLVLNLPYIFDLFKGTRLKANYLFRAIRVSKERIDIIMFPKRMGLTTEKAYFSTKERVRWYKFPNIKELYPSLVEEYEKAKLSFNSRMKEKFSRRETSSINKAMGI